MPLHDARHLQRVDPQVLDEDPFWSVVRRRHPDLGVVLLPPAQPSGPEEHTPDIGAVRAGADDLTGAWARVRRLVLATEAVEATTAPSLRWATGEVGHALLVEKALTGLGQDGGEALLRALVAELGEAGWTFRPERRNGLPFLAATDGTVDLEATAGPGATVMTLATGLLPVGPEDREAVLRDVRQEVSSWV